MRVEYADALVDPIKAEILAVLDPAPDDEDVALPGGFRARELYANGGAIADGRAELDPQAMAAVSVPKVTIVA